MTTEMTMERYGEILEETRRETVRHQAVAERYRNGEVDDDEVMASLRRYQAQDAAFEEAYAAAEQLGEVEDHRAEETETDQLQLWS